MKQIHIFGSSHAKRLLTAFRKLKLENVQITGTVKPGATVKDLPVQDLFRLTEKDILIVQVFGNELLRKNIKVENKPTNKKIIHLTKFEQKSQEQIMDSFQYLKNVLLQIKSQILIIDNPIRHLSCCKHHNYAGLFSFQAKQNKLLRKFFAGYQVLKHENLIDLKIVKKSKKSYIELFEDTVHFKEVFYKQMANNIRLNNF